MNLSIWDWGIVLLFLAMIFFCVFYFKRYTRSVSDFMVASRLAGPYMLTIAPGIIGGIGMIASVQAHYNNGFSSGWWSTLMMPVSLMLTLFGFVSYRLRQTRAMTLSQFLEARYSRKFRIFAGILCWVSGVLNFGVFPMVSARCFIYLMGLPETVPCGNFALPVFPLMVFALVALPCLIACVGGQVGILFSGFFMNLISFALCLVFMYFMLYKFHWGTIIEGLHQVENPDTQSLVNPFKAFDADGFNIWYFVILMAFNSYTRGCWQGGGGFSMAAKTPHDGLMSAVIMRWRTYAQNLMLILLPLGAYAMFHLPQFAEIVAPIQAQLDAIGDKAVIDQVRIPLLLTRILPVGMFGLFIVMLLAGTVSSDASYVHSWGTILIQDIIMPFRKKPFEAKEHLLYLRLGILGVGIFSFLWSVLFPLKDFISMYFMITGAIYMGGAGAVVIGGLYWKRGSTYAAWTALIVGTIVCIVGLGCQSFWNYVYPALHNAFPDWAYLTENAKKFPIPSHITTFIAMCASIASYILVSLLGPKHVHNMDKLLHRGEYACGDTIAPVQKPKFTWARLFGVTPEHTRFERNLMYASFSITMADWIVFAVVTLLALTMPLSDHFWEELEFWRKIPLYAILGTVCTIWIVGGGIRDAFRLIKDLRAYKEDQSDDGFVEE